MFQIIGLQPPGSVLFYNPRHTNIESVSLFYWVLFSLFVSRLWTEDCGSQGDAMQEASVFLASPREFLALCSWIPHFLCLSNMLLRSSIPKGWILRLSNVRIVCIKQLSVSHITRSSLNQKEAEVGIFCGLCGFLITATLKDKALSFYLTLENTNILIS